MLLEDPRSETSVERILLGPQVSHLQSCFDICAEYRYSSSKEMNVGNPVSSELRVRGTIQLINKNVLRVDG